MNVIINHVLQVLGTIPDFKTHTEDPTLTQNIWLLEKGDIYLIVLNTYFWCTDIILAVIHFSFFQSLQYILQ